MSPPPKIRSWQRFGFPLTIAVFLTVSAGLNLLGFALIEPTSIVVVVLVATGTIVGTAVTVSRRDAVATTSSVGGVSLLGPLAFIALASPSGVALLAFDAVALGCLLVLLLAGLRTPLDATATIRARRLRFGVLAFGTMAFTAGLIFTLMLTACAVVDAATGGFGSTEREELPSPDGKLLLVIEYFDQGALGGDFEYSLVQRLVPHVIQRELDVPFDDSDFHELRWLDDRRLSVDGQEWTVGQPLEGPPTTQRGVEWAAVRSGTEDTLFDVSFAGGTGWAVGDFGTMLKTIDGGFSWTTVKIPSNDSLYSVCFVDTNRGWVVTAFGAILHTSDGGRTWTEQRSGVELQLFDVRFIDANTGWIVGERGTILHTVDGGATWAHQDSGVSSGLACAYFHNERAGLAAGEDGTVLSTVDGGTSWTKVYRATSGLRAIFFVEPNTGWAVGTQGTIIKTVDGGASWSAIDPPTDAFLEDVAFVDAETGWVVGVAMRGSVTVVLMTSDGGVTWTQEPAGQTDGLYALSLTDGGVGLAAGSWGAILRPRETDGP